MIIDTTNDELLINGQRWQRGGYLLATAYATDQINITARDGRVIGKAIEWDRILDKDKNTFGLDRDGTVTALTNIFNSQVKSPYKIDALRDVENGTAAYGEVMIYRSPGEWQYEVLEQYHGAYDSEAATLRSGATATLELYYTAQADGDGISELSQSNTPTSGYKIIRKLYYAERAQQDPDTGTWVQFADLAANTSFNDAKNALLAYLKERTGGTVPISLKMTWEEVELLLLEEYPGAAAAYSLRLLDNTYTGSAIRVRRASDNAEQDIGFDGNGDLDTSALATFCSGTDGFVKTWYDQANSNNAVQATTASQPKIYFDRTNLILQSNQFDTDWTSNNTTETGGQAGYDGTSDGWLLAKTAANGETRQSVDAGLRTFSIYAKAGSLSWLYLLKGGNAGQYFNLGTGVLGSPTGTGGNVPLDAKIEDVGGGWYRCSMTYNDLYPGSLRIYPADGDNDTSGTTGNIYIQDAQLEAGYYATDYIETTTSPVTVSGVVTQGGKPAVQFDGDNDYFTKAFTLGNPVSHFVVGKVTDFNQFLLDGYGAANRNSLVAPTNPTPRMRLYNGGGSIFNPITFGNQYLFSSISNGVNSSLAVNGSNNTSTLGTDTMDGVTIGIAGTLSTSFCLDGTIQEVVLYDSDQSSNRTGIETNINDYYSIYP